MNIYFCGSIRGGRADVDFYARIVEKLKQFGTVLTEIVADKTVTHMDVEIEAEIGLFTIRMSVGWSQQMVNIIAMLTVNTVQSRFYDIVDQHQMQNLDSIFSQF